MAEEYVTISCNAATAEELATVLDSVSEVLGVQAVPGQRVLLESAAPPLNVIIDLVGASAAVYQAVGGPPICKLLLDKLKERVLNRRVQVQFTPRKPKDRPILYHGLDDTPNQALTRIAYDYEHEREVESPTPMRWWADGEWKTIEEYQEWRRRK
jgi:hypothetical protein